MISHDVIEHVPDPAHLLHGLENIVREGGAIFLSTPHAGSPAAAAGALVASLQSLTRSIGESLGAGSGAPLQDRRPPATPHTVHVAYALCRELLWTFFSILLNANTENSLFI